MEDVIVRVVDLPDVVGGVTVIDENGDYNIYLNARRADLAREFRHEMRHIRRDDFHNGLPLSVAEMRGM